MRCTTVVGLWPWDYSLGGGSLFVDVSVWMGCIGPEVVTLRTHGPPLSQHACVSFSGAVLLFRSKYKTTQHIALEHGWVCVNTRTGYSLYIYVFIIYLFSLFYWFLCFTSYLVHTKHVRTWQHILKYMSSVHACCVLWSLTPRLTHALPPSARQSKDKWY